MSAVVIVLYVIKTVTLTTGVDTVAGTAGNDTIRALAVNPSTSAGATTLNSLDAIDGGAGTDTLNITVGTETVNSAAVYYNAVQQGTVTGVETINIDNSGAAAGHLFGTVSTGASNGKVVASGFVGATTITQIGGSVDVLDLASTTTAGFKSGAVANVSAAATATTVTIALDKAAGANGSLQSATASGQNKIATLSVGGAGLSAVNVSGTVLTETAGTQGRVGAVDLTIAGGKSATGAALDVSLNTSILTKVTLQSASTTGNIAKFDASASAGAIEFAGTSTNSATTAGGVATLLTGAGADIVTLATATAVDNVNTAFNEAVSASVNTAGGNDTITVSTSGAGTTSVNAGAGDDTVTVSSFTATGGLTLNAGDGDDTVDVSAGGLGAGSTISGDAGKDTLVVKGDTITGTGSTANAASYGLAEYTALSTYTSSFEVLKFKANVGVSQGGSSGTNAAAIDASKLSSAITEIQFAGAGSIAKVGSQALTLLAAASVTNSLTATASGYVAAVTGVSDAVYAGALNVTSKEDGATLTLAGASAAVTVAASTSAGNEAYLAGDLQAASVAISSVRATSSGVSTGVEYLGKITVDLNGQGHDETLAGLKSLTVTGAGVVVVDAVDANSDANALTLINLSGQTAFANLDAAGDQVTTVPSAGYGYQNLSTSDVNLNNGVAETVKLGGGDDTVHTASIVAKMDTIEGFELVALASNPLQVNESKSDALDITPSIGTVRAITLTGTPADLNAALLQAGAATYIPTGQTSPTAADDVVFSFGGNTYFYHDTGANGLDTSDVVVKFVGALDLNLLGQVIG